MSRFLTITSGKGGVGKTNLSLNLALCLSRMGHRTCLFDADLGLANINILLGLYPEHDLKDVVSHDRTLEEIIIRTEEGLEIIPGRSGMEEMANLESEQVDALIQSFVGMGQYEFFLFDTSAGISRNVISICLASSEVIVVVTPEPTSMIDAFALLKILYMNGFAGDARLVFNQCKTSVAGKKAYTSFRSTVAKHLKQEVVPLGMIPEDERLVEAVRIQKPLMSAFPGSAAAKCIEKIAARLVANGDASSASMDMEGFWSRCLQVIRGSLKLPKKAKENQTEPASPPTKQEIPTLEPREPMGSDKTLLPDPEVPKPVPADTKQPSDSQEISSVDAERVEGPMEPLAHEVPALEPRGPVDSDETPPPDSDVPKPVQTDTNQSAASQGLPLVGAGNAEGPIGSFLPVLEKLIESINSVSRETQLIREMIAGNGTALLHQAGSSNRPYDESPPQLIRLDLDAFIRSCQSEIKE